MDGVRLAVITPETNWRRAVESVGPGDELTLAPGDYEGGWIVDRGGTPDAPVILSALDERRPPRLTPSTAGSTVIDVRADNVTIRGLAFAPTPSGLHAVTLSGASGVTIEDCRFDGIGGLAIVETITGRRIVVRRNHIRRSRTTALYFGCHEGDCVIAGLLIEGNSIEGVDAPRGEIGYGIQVKLNSHAVIRDNVVLDTKGPAIMVYGARDSRLVSIIEGNRVARSRRSSGVVLGGGPALVRHNVATDNAQGGIALENYGGRNLLRAIEVSDNTVYGNRRGGILVPRAKPVEARIIGNVAHARWGTRALPAPRAGVVLRDNIDCSGSSCHNGA